MNAGAAAAEEPDLALAAGPPDQPTDSGERIVTLDFIRGIAVLGILFPNIVAYAHPILAYFWPPQLPGGATAFDEATWLFQLVLIDGKFRGLFTLLFGAGMMLFIERVWARGGTRRLQARRLFWLALFGLAHFYLLWTGDILFLYAISGLLALSMLKWQARTQLRRPSCDRRSVMSPAKRTPSSCASCFRDSRKKICRAARAGRWNTLRSPRTTVRIWMHRTTTTQRTVTAIACRRSMRCRSTGTSGLV